MHSHGVTLIELLIVMIIVAVLSIVIFISMSQSIVDAQAAQQQDFNSNAIMAVRSWNSSCMRRNPNFNLMSQSQWNAQIPNAVRGTTEETLSWFAFLRAGDLGLQLTFGSTTELAPNGNDWLNYNSAEHLENSLPGFDSNQMVIRRKALGAEWEFAGY